MTTTEAAQPTETDADRLAALTMDPAAGRMFWKALIYAANRIPAEARAAHDDLSHEEWLRWGASRLDAAIRAAEAPAEYLIWSHHHQMWWGPNGSGYRGQIVDAGRYSLDDAQKELGRGCGCCAVPEVVIAAPGLEVFSKPGRVGEWASRQIKAATDARFSEGKIDRHAAVPAVTADGSDQEAAKEN